MSAEVWVLQQKSTLMNGGMAVGNGVTRLERGACLGVLVVAAKTCDLALES